jgi:hypothetical protein
MKLNHLIVLLVSLLITAFFLSYGFLSTPPSRGKSPDVLVGVDVAYGDVEEIKKVADQVSSYTNLIVIGCSGITNNATKLNETCQYVYDKGLSFIIYLDRAPRTQWLEDAKTRWGNRFLGFYAFDEVGGWQLDLQKYRVVQEADNHSDASTQFVDGMNRILTRFTRYYPNSTHFPLFSSDYALYWFDYKAGYDTLFAEFGWNYSRQLNVALCRGAATVQNKDWGIIITWTYNHPPYIESGKELYNDLVLAYENGAKYITILDTDQNYTQGILKDEHLQALKQFWQYVQNNPRSSIPTSDRVAYVLPKDYAYGFRGPNDKIWGFWEADSFSIELCKSLNSQLEQHGTKLDIVYDDGLQPNNTNGYSKVIFWNGTTLNP